jgi:hypothetical protein
MTPFITPFIIPFIIYDALRISPVMYPKDQVGVLI